MNSTLYSSTSSKKTNDSYKKRKVYPGRVTKRRSQTSRSKKIRSQPSCSKTSRSQTSRSQMSRSQTSRSQTSRSQTRSSQTSRSQTSCSQTICSQTSRSQTSCSQTSCSQTICSQTSCSQTSCSPSSCSQTPSLYEGVQYYVPEIRTIKEAKTYKKIKVNEVLRKPYEAIDKSDIVNTVGFIKDNIPQTKMCRSLREWIFNPNNKLNIHSLLNDSTVHQVENNLKFSRITNDRELEIISLTIYNITKSYLQNVTSTNEWSEISKFLVKNLYSLAQKVVDTNTNTPSISIYFLQHLLISADVSVYHSGVAMGILILTMNNERIHKYELSKITAAALFFSNILLDGVLSYPFDIKHLWTSKLENASKYTANKLFTLVQLFAIFATHAKRPEFARFYKRYKNQKHIIITYHEACKKVAAMYREIIKIKSL